MKRQRSFTLLELIISITILAVLSVLAYSGYGIFLNRSRLSAADSDLNKLANASKLYAATYNAYPPDVDRNIPSEIKAFIDSQDENDNWPNASWPESIFDYDHGTPGGVDTVQIAIRFCPKNGPLSACKFPPESWASGFNINSAYYYCIKGNCRAHFNELPTYPGYCVNCPGHKAIGT